MNSSDQKTSSKDSWWKTTIIIIAMILGGTIGGGIAKEMFAEAGSPSVEEAMEQAAREINQKAPIKVDDKTTLTGATTINREMIYSMKISFELPKQDLSEIQLMLQQQNQRAICGNSKTRSIIDMGVTMTHAYSDASEEYFTTSVTSCA